MKNSGGSVKGDRPEARRLGSLSALPLTYCVTLDKSLCPSGPQFPHLQNGGLGRMISECV